MGWRYIAQRIDGSGQPGEILDTDLPLSGVSLTDVLSGPIQLSGTISPAIRRLLASDGMPILEEWGTVIHAEADGVIRGSAIYVHGQFKGAEWELECVGFAGYPTGMFYENETQFIDTDPLDIVRHIWAHLQGGASSNLGVVVDSETHTPVRVGTPAEQVDFTTGEGENVSFEAGPVKLNWWTTDDCGKVIEDLAKETPFEYRERHQWDHPVEKNVVQHFIDFGYPRLGQRREDLRFVLGENIQTIPTLDRPGDEFSNHVLVLGSGEGRDMVHATARQQDRRIRRTAVVDAKDIQSNGSAQSRAVRELNWRLQLMQVTEFAVMDSPMTPLGSWQPGDEIRLQAKADWGSVDLWFRVVAITLRPENPEIITMTVLRSDKVQ